jgi:cation:H+ antiporter
VLHTPTVSDLSVPLLVLVFLAAAAAIWFAGVFLSNTVDVLDERLHLGAALGGTILLAIVTNLPEIAITASAALQHAIGVAVGNILGGVAIQTVVLAVLDAFGVRPQRPLTYQAASLVLVLETALVMAVLVVTVMGTQLPAHLYYLRVTPSAALILVLWLLGMLLLSRAQRGLPWHDGGQPPDSPQPPMGHAKKMKEKHATERGISTRRAGTIFIIAAAVTLAAGVVLERAGNGLASHLHVSGVLFGATFLAAATALPELSTGLTSTRMGDYQLAMSDIFGGNAFLPVLFVLADLLSGRAVLPQAHDTDIYLTGLGALLTAVYAVGLLFRPTRNHARMGYDSIAVIVLYALGLAGLVALAQG